METPQTVSPFFHTLSPCLGGVVEDRGGYNNSSPVHRGTDERSKYRRQIYLHYALQGGGRRSQSVQRTEGFIPHSSFLTHSPPQHNKPQKPRHEQSYTYHSKHQQ